MARLSAIARLPRLFIKLTSEIPHDDTNRIPGSWPQAYLYSLHKKEAVNTVRVGR
jgi:hypothetical protein